MRHFESTTVIDASQDDVWAILTDAAAYSDWDSGVIKLEGRVAPGEKLKVTSEVNPKRAYPVKITEFSPGQRMAWTGGVPLKLFTGVRTFTSRRRTAPRGSACARSSPARCCR
jgi:uncharacterized protein YndB with AHSA1/START domain